MQLSRHVLNVKTLLKTMLVTKYNNGIKICLWKP